MSLVHLDSVLFKADKAKGELQAEVAGRCLKGKDHTIDVQIELLDASAHTVASLKGHGGIEEGDKGTIKAKQRLSAADVDRITQFRLTFQAKPD